MVCLRIDSGIDLIVKTQKEIFPTYHCFWSQRLFVPMNMVLKRYLACQTPSKCQPYYSKKEPALLGVTLRKT